MKWNFPSGYVYNLKEGQKEGETLRHVNTSWLGKWSACDEEETKIWERATLLMLWRYTPQNVDAIWRNLAKWKTNP